MKKLTRASAIILSALSPLAALADARDTVTGSFVPSGAPATGGLYGIGTLIISLINNVLVPLIFAAAFVVFLWGVYKSYIASGGEPAEREKGHQLILWGLIGFFVMLSVWGLVNIVTNTFGLNQVGAPSLPSSQPSS